MKKFMSGLAIAAIASTAFVGAASAQWTDTARRERRRLERQCQRRRRVDRLDPTAAAAAAARPAQETAAATLCLALGRL